MTDRKEKEALEKCNKELALAICVWQERVAANPKGKYFCTRDSGEFESCSRKYRDCIRKMCEDQFPKPADGESPIIVGHIPDIGAGGGVIQGGGYLAHTEKINRALRNFFAGQVGSGDKKCHFCYKSIKLVETKDGRKVEVRPARGAKVKYRNKKKEQEAKWLKAFGKNGKIDPEKIKAKFGNLKCDGPNVIKPEEIVLKDEADAPSGGSGSGGL